MPPSPRSGSAAAAVFSRRDFLLDAEEVIEAKEVAEGKANEVTAAVESLTTELTKEDEAEVTAGEEEGSDVEDDAAEEQWLEYQMKKWKAAEKYPVPEDAAEDADPKFRGVAMHAEDIPGVAMQARAWKRQERERRVPVINLRKSVAMDNMELVRNPEKTVEMYSCFPPPAGTIVSLFTNADQLDKELIGKLRTGGVFPGLVEPFIDRAIHTKRERFEGYYLEGFRVVVARVVPSVYSTKSMSLMAQNMAEYAEEALNAGLVPGFWNSLQGRSSNELLTCIRQGYSHLFLCVVVSR